MNLSTILIILVRLFHLRHEIGILLIFIFSFQSLIRTEQSSLSQINHFD